MTTDGKKSTDLYVDPKTKYGKDCLMPKRPLSSYLYYTTENVNAIKKKEGCTHPQAMKKCGEQWKKMSASDKKVYEEKNAKDVQRFKKQSKDLDK